MKEGIIVAETIHTKQTSICNCMNIRRSSLAITKVYNEFLAPSGLLISQYSSLKHIERLGPVSVSTLALEIRLDRTTLVRNLKALEERAYIIDVAPQGARNRQLKLTDAGRTILKTAEPLWHEAQDYLADYLGEEDKKTLMALLAKIEALVP